VKTQKPNNFWHFLHTKHHISRRSLLIGALVIVVGTLITTSYGTYHFYARTKLEEAEKNRLIADVMLLSSQRDSLQANIAERDATILKNIEDLNAKSTQIQELEKHVSGLNQQISELNKRIQSLGRSSNTSIQPKTTIYDRVQVSDAFRPQVIRALELIQANDSHVFSVLNTHVEAIYEMQGCGGFQVKRPIYVGNCGYAESDVVIASIIVHEAVHIENVYIKRIVSIGTKEQELPAYQREYQFASKLGAPQWFLDSILNQIAYYESLPK
jgi:hypothetical protein